MTVTHDLDDKEVNQIMADQLGVENYYFDETKHHLYHAESAYYFSPWYQNNESVIAIAWDGGGASTSLRFVSELSRD